LIRGAIALSGDRIVAVLPEGSELPAADETIDLGGAYLAPGFVDLHIHGGAGVDVMEAEELELRRFAGWLGGQGTTRFLPTIVPTSLEEYDAVVARIARWVGRALLERPVGAIPIGIHFEGPFLNRARCGALRAANFLNGTDRDRFFESVGVDRLDGLPARLVTLAPEVENGVALVRACAARGLRVAIGHTEADGALLDRAFEAGARHVTHFMNGMPQLHHRAPGPVGWALLRDSVSVDIIGDLAHVDAEVLRLVVRTKGASHIALISDAVAPAGLGDGTYRLWGETIRVANDRTSNGDGNLAGSVSTIRDGVRNMVNLGVPLVDAIRMSSLIPSRILGLQAFGALGTGKIADCIAFHEEIEPILTVVAGNVVHRVGV
jgi:N-acetylglucosamine-6-phosphate deacetylase